MAKKRSRIEVTPGKHGETKIRNVVPKTRDKIIINPKKRRKRKVFKI